MRNVKRLIIFFTVFALFTCNADYIGFSKASAFSPDFEVKSEAAFMVNLDTDLTVYKKNEFIAVHPASTTKIMTALLVLEHAENLNAFVNVPDEMNTGFGKNPNFEGAGAADFTIGQSNLTYMDCLYALMLHSACDAANVLAINIGGTIDNFVTMMNQKTRELGCVNTNFTNAHGLHEKDNFSCAYDMFLITKYVMEKFPEFMEIVSKTGHDLPANSRNPNGVSIGNTNRLVRNIPDNPYYYEFARGVKTGSIDEYYDVDTGTRTPGNFSLVSTAVRNGYNYLLVTLGAPYYDPERLPEKVRVFWAYDDHISLYRWAFSTLEYQTVLSAHDIIEQIAVKNGQDATRVQLQPARDFSTLLPNTVDKTAIHRKVTLSANEIEAPVKKGEVLGWVQLLLAEEELASIELIAAQDIDVSIAEGVMTTLKDILNTSWFRACIAAIFALIIFVFILRSINIRRHRAHARRRKYRR